MADVGISVKLAGMDAVTRGFGRMGTEARGLGASATTASKGVDSLSGSMRRLQQAVLTLGLARIGQNVIQTALAFQRFERVLTLSTGSAKNAAEAMQFVRATSDKLGLDLQEAAGGFSRITIAAKGTSLEGKEARKIFTSISEAASVLGMSADQTSGAFRAIEQMISKGNVSAEELRGQLGERLPGAFILAAKAIGITTKELNKMLEQGQVSAAEFLPLMAREIHRTFAIAVPSAADSAQASINRFSTAWQDFQVSFAKSGFMDAVVETMQELAKTMKDPQFLKSVTAIGEAFAEMIKMVGPALDFVGKGIMGIQGMIADAKKATGKGNGGWFEGNWEMGGGSAGMIAEQEAGGGKEGRASEKRASAGRRAGLSVFADAKEMEALRKKFKDAANAANDAATAKVAALKAEEKAIADLADWDERLADLRERNWENWNSLLEASLTPLEQYKRELQELEVAFKGVEGEAENYNRVLDDMNKALAESNESVRAVETAFDSIFDAAIEGGEDFMDTLESIGKTLAKDLVKANVYDPLKDIGKRAVGGLLGGGKQKEEGEGGGAMDPMAMVFGKFIGGLRDLFNGDDGLLGKFGEIFGGAWESLTGIFTWFLGESWALAAWETIERWAISIWDTGQRWAIVIWEIIQLWAVAIFNAVAGLFGLETGGDVTVTRPTLIMVGEKNKAERLHVSPLGGPPRADREQMQENARNDAGGNVLQPNVNIFLPQSSIINGLTEGHFARQIAGVVRRQNGRYV